MVLIIVVTVSCSNHPTNNTSIDMEIMSSKETDELWLINFYDWSVRTELNINKITSIIDENNDLFTIDGYIDYELFKEFMTEHFKSLVIITYQDQIEKIFDYVRPCCRVNIKTRTIRITIVIRD